MKDRIEHVSDTAFWVAYYRGLEGQRPDALFHDPLALKLVGTRGEALARRMGIKRAMAWSLSLRTYIIDHYILEAIAGGTDCVVNLGAGLDTRPYRLDLPKDFQWFEVDFSHMIDFKNDTLLDDRPVCQLQRIACDLSDAQARRDLLDGLNARANRILVLTEGVVPYLTNDDVAALATDLHQQNHITHWLTDYFSPLFKTVSQRGNIMKQLEKNAPFRFDAGPAPLDWSTFFAGNGWQIEEMRFIGEVGKTLGRDLPANWLMRFLMRFAQEERLQPYRRMNGYALLKKGQEVVAI